MSVIIVEVCESNFITNIDLENLLESEYPEVSVVMIDCLSFCGMCARSPYAMVNGKRVFAKTVEECLVKIREQIEEELAFFHG
ncbi:DUF1450 domain-containing protein [Niallia sp. Krafla_26]|uniref:DUF1450 domain-containing protein n=1 Tax=Niallia sp. Krafla_26 TaxID=3064703 RepID=UPI003D168BBB